MVNEQSLLEIKSSRDYIAEHVHGMRKQIFENSNDLPRGEDIVKVMTHYMLNESKNKCSLETASWSSEWASFYGLSARAVSFYAGQDLAQIVDDLDEDNLRWGEFINLKKAERKGRNIWYDDEIVLNLIFEGFTQVLKENENKFPNLLAKAFWTLFYPEEIIIRDFYCCKFNFWAGNYLGVNGEPSHRKVLDLENRVIPSLKPEYYSALEEIGKIGYKLLIE